jgi:integrase
LNAYLTFCNIHNLPVDPTQDTLSFFVVFLSSYIKPDSVNSYLSGICRQLEPFFPEIRRNRNSMLVSRTMTGCMRRFGSAVDRKSPLSHANLLFVLDSMVSAPSHDELLFAAIILTAFYALMRLGELVFLDKRDHRNYRKLSLRHSVSVLPSQYSFFLPYHKGDRFFEGNTIVVQKNETPTNPYHHFLAYLASRDSRFPLHPELWLTSRGSVPTRHWFISRLRTFFPKNIAGHSLRSGGATSLAEGGADLDTIQAVGRWSSNAFRIYIRKNPVVIHAILLGRPAHQPL